MIENPESIDFIRFFGEMLQIVNKRISLLLFSGLGI